MKHLGSFFRTTLIISVVMLLGYVVLQNFNRVERTGAAATRAAFEFAPSTATLAASEEKQQTITITAADGKKISAFDLNLMIVGDLQITGVTSVTAVGGAADTFGETIKTISGTSARLVYTSQKATAELPSAVAVQVTVKSTGGAAGTLSVDAAKTKVTGNIPEIAFDTSVGGKVDYNGGSVVPSIIIDPPKPDPTLPPRKTSGPPILSVEAKNAQGRAVRVLQLGRVECDKNTDNSKNCILGSRQSNISSDTYSKGKVDANKEWVGVMIRLKPNQRIVNVVRAPTGSSITGCYQAGAPNNNYYCSVWQDDKFTQGENRTTIIVSETTSPTPTVTPTVTTVPPPGNATLNIKLRVQGIFNKKEATLPVKVSLVREGTSAAPLTQTANFTSNDSGIWEGSVTFNTPAGSNYKLLVKGPKHIQKKICVATPTETAEGTYTCSEGSINLVTGVNNIDLTGIRLLTGDLPDQDGVVNAYDIALITNSFAKTDQESLRVADVNYDGAVNTIDYAYMIAALRVRADEN